MLCDVGPARFLRALRALVVVLASVSLVAQLVARITAVAPPAETEIAAQSLAGSSLSPGPDTMVTETEDEQEDGVEGLLHAHGGLAHDWLPIERAHALDVMHTHDAPEGPAPSPLLRPPRA